MADPPAVNTWQRAADAAPGRRDGGVLVPAAGGREMLLIGGSAAGDNNPATVQVFDVKGRAWRTVPKSAPPVRKGVHCYYQAVRDPVNNLVYCMHEGTLLTYAPATRTWKTLGQPKVLAETSWHAMALAPKAQQLVVIGADKAPANLGWTRTAVLDLATKTWRRLPDPPAAMAQAHAKLVGLREETTDWLGRVRLAWFRSPDGTGTPPEREEIRRRGQAIREKLAQQRKADAATAAALAAALEATESRDLLTALRKAAAVFSAIDRACDAQYPVPCSRRNAPLVFDARHKVFVLFGGDHEDYQMNDTWLLDLAADVPGREGKGAWRRVRSPEAPAPRAGHAMVYLPATGQIAMVGGYVANTEDWYRCAIIKPVGDRYVWLFDAAAGRWHAGLPAYPPAPADPKKRHASTPLEVAMTGRFCGYSAQWFVPPALAVAEAATGAAQGKEDVLILAGRQGRRGKTGTWSIRLQADSLAPCRDKKAIHAPDQRRYRGGRFSAAYGVVKRPVRNAVAELPANTWVALPEPARNVCYGCRQRDWGTSVWDSRHEQILLWGGGHCIRAASSVVHYSPVTAHMVEGYDADEPYGYNGGGGWGSSLWNRPWIPPHAYNTYAYDPPSGLMVTATGFLYDPVRMDWLRKRPMKRPFRFQWGHTVLEATPHGAVAWARANDSDRVSLWLYEHGKGWRDLKPGRSVAGVLRRRERGMPDSGKHENAGESVDSSRLSDAARSRKTRSQAESTPVTGRQGRLRLPYCDSEGMIYDAKRDRMLIGWGGGYQKTGDGTLQTYDFRTNTIARLTPAQADLGRIKNTREMVYLDHADCVLFGATPWAPGSRGGLRTPPKGTKRYTLLYDCAANRYRVLNAGDHEGLYGHSTGWVYDAKRKLVYVFTNRGRAFALRLDPKTATWHTPAPDPDAPPKDPL